MSHRESLPCQPVDGLKHSVKRSVQVLNEETMPPADSRYANVALVALGRGHVSRQRSPAHILIVDDQTAMRDFVDRALRAVGYCTVRAVDGPDALELARTFGPFDLLLTDEKMPRMEGHELARQLRLQEPHLKVLYLTGYSDRLFSAKGKLDSEEALLEKPSTVTGLLKAVALLLNR